MATRCRLHWHNMSMPCLKSEFMINCNIYVCSLITVTSKSDNRNIYLVSSLGIINYIFSQKNVHSPIQLLRLVVTKHLRIENMRHVVLYFLRWPCEPLLQRLGAYFKDFHFSISVKHYKSQQRDNSSFNGSGSVQCLAGALELLQSFVHKVQSFSALYSGKVN